MRRYSWDDEVQDEIANKIEGWFEHLKGLAEVKIPRCLRSSEPRPVTRILCGGVLMRPMWTKLPKCFFLFNFF